MSGKACSMCEIYKSLDLFVTYRTNKGEIGYRKICKDCLNQQKKTKRKTVMTNSLSETQLAIRNTISICEEFIDDPDMLQMLSERMTQYAQWLAIEQKSNKINSVLAYKTDIDLHHEKSIVGNVNTKIHEKCSYYQKAVHSKLQHEILLNDIHIVLYDKSYLVHIDNPKITVYLLNALR